MQTKIEHVVVLMLENRSFDHLFGRFPGANGIAADSSNLLDPSAPQSDANPRIAAETGAPFAIDIGDGPSHSLDATNVQLSGDKSGPTAASPATNVGFVKSYRNSLFSSVRHPNKDQLAIPMLCFAPDQLPALNALAREFVLCNNWFAEVPGPTMPNRFFMHAATSAGFVHNVWDRTFELVTIYERLANKGRTWGTYYFDHNEVAQFTRINDNPDAFRLFERFAEDARANKLPNYTFIVPGFGDRAGGLNNSMHAPQDIRPGDTLIADVYDALRANEEAWSKTLLVVTFDEHGGFYDHVIPPSTGVPRPDAFTAPRNDDPSWVRAFDFERLGLRVPAILASPWLAKGAIVSKQLQHTSVLATLNNLFGPFEALTKRDRSAAAFDDLLQAEMRTDTPVILPRLHADIEHEIASAAAEESRRPDELVSALVRGWQVIADKAEAETTGFEPFRMDPGPPETLKDAGDRIRAQLGRYLNLRARKQEVGAPETGRFQEGPPGSMVRNDLLGATESRFQPHNESAGAPGLDSIERFVARAMALGVSEADAREFAKHTSDGPESAPLELKGVATLERILGTNDLLPSWFVDAASRSARAVGRIVLRRTGGQVVGYGTGFLISPRLLITNNHVLGDSDTASRASADFDYAETASRTAPVPKTFRLDPDTLFITSKDLDYAVVAVKSYADLAEFGFLTITDGDRAILEGEAANIVLHPNGEPKQIALRENRITSTALESFLQYKTDTAPGASGSPVFDDQWELLAIHHSGVPKRDAQGNILATDGSIWTDSMGETRVDWIANEGVRFSRIAADLRTRATDAQRPLVEEALRGVRAPAATQRVATPGPVVTPPPAPPEPAQPTERGGATVDASGGSEVRIQVPIEISIRIGTPETGSAVTTDAAPAKTAPVRRARDTSNGAPDGILRIDLSPDDDSN